MSNTMKIDTNRKEEIKEARTIKNRDRVIEFRDDKEKNRKRKSWMVPTDLLRFRKENARIESKVRTYEKSVGTIIEDSKEGQKR